MPILLAPDAVMERPGVGIVISSAEALGNPFRGQVAFLGRSRKGPLNRAMRCTNVPSITRLFGGAPYGVDAGNTMDGAIQALIGRAIAVWVVRMGSGGAASTLTIGDLVVEAIGPGTDGNLLAVAIVGAGLDARRHLVVLEGGVERERFSYAPVNVQTEVDNVIAAVNRYGSNFIVVSRVPATPPGNGGTRAAAFLPETPATSLTGGADPTITVGDIQSGLDALAAAPVEVAASDLLEDSEQDLFVENLNTWIFSGKLALGVLGAHPDMGWNERQGAATNYNNPAITYVGNGFVSNRLIPGAQSNVVAGYQAAGREAGRLAALPLARQLTHSVVPDGIQTVDEPPPDVIAANSAAGVYQYSTNSRGQVWTEWGITTQKNFDQPPPWALATDSGWGKQRLVLTRFRLMTDIELAWAPLIETATNNDAGRDSIRTEAQNVIDLRYVPTGAVERGQVILHPDYPPVGERATFLVEIVTPDGAEFLVLEARFRR